MSSTREAGRLSTEPEPADRWPDAQPDRLQPAAVPPAGLRRHLLGVHHIGIPVRSLARSLAWYRDVWGLEPQFVQRSWGPETSKTVQLEAADLRFAFIDLGSLVIELLEYTHPRGLEFSLRNCDVGATHVCLDVDDIDDVFDRLSEMGVDFSIGPTTHGPGPLAGHRCCYFRDPDGIQFELWQRPAPPTARLDSTPTVKD